MTRELPHWREASQDGSTNSSGTGLTAHAVRATDGTTPHGSKIPTSDARLSTTTPDATPSTEAAVPHEYFRALVQTLSDPTLVLDENLNVRDLTPSAGRLFEREIGDLPGRHVLSIVHPDDRSSAAAFFSHALETPGTSPAAEWRVQHRDGHWIDLEVVCNNVLDDPRLRCLVLSGRDVSPRKELERQLSHQAFHDPLTDLANRALMLDRVEHAFKRQQNPFALLFLDLDNFKNVNDSLGHAAGDELLTGVAARLRTCLRPTDTAARLGGDEFALILEETRTADQAIEVAERVLRAMSEPFSVGERESFTQTSIGIAMSALVETPDELLRNADIAMYQAKQRGKGTFVVFEPTMHKQALERSELEADLRGAIARQQLFLNYQPIIELASGRIVGLEALLRWNHPDRGVLAPNRFVEIAEESGLIHPIGEWVLEQACSQLGIWQREFPRQDPLVMAINLSGRQLENDEILTQIRGSSAAAGIEPSSLLLEITETVMVKDAEQCAEMLTELRGLGSRIAVDDFGMGYSSLHYLHSFPIDLLKVAKPFVDGVARDEQEAVFTRTIMDLCRTLGLTALAEGVESGAQAEALRNLRCELGQGFYLSRPLDSSATTALLAQGGLLGRYANEVAGRTIVREKTWWKNVTGAQKTTADINSIGQLPPTSAGDGERSLT